MNKYEPSINAWCRRWNLQEADIHDISQMVLLRLAVKMRTFTYDSNRSFRAWLKTLTRHAWSDFVADQKRKHGRVAGDTDLLQSAEARDDLERRLAETFDLELLEIATEKVKERVKPHSWQAFDLTANHRMSGAEVAAQLGMSITAVFKAKSSILKMLRDEIDCLDREQPV